MAQSFDTGDNIGAKLFGQKVLKLMGEKLIKEEEFEKQAQFIKDNIDVVLEDIKENQGFLSKDNVERALDYDNEGVFSRGNWIEPGGSGQVISYRIFISVYPKETYCKKLMKAVSSLEDS
ncbi:hypothetical protein KAR91_35155 [Candidatus Pacearchaeota archaeon]|nr:hypothetical protein [Candidatus Pacearchaeota archaeon]